MRILLRSESSWFSVRPYEVIFTNVDLSWGWESCADVMMCILTSEYDRTKRETSNALCLKVISAVNGLVMPRTSRSSLAEWNLRFCHSARPTESLYIHVNRASLSIAGTNPVRQEFERVVWLMQLKDVIKRMSFLYSKWWFITFGSSCYTQQPWRRGWQWCSSCSPYHLPSGDIPCRSTCSPGI